MTRSPRTWLTPSAVAVLLLVLIRNIFAAFTITTSSNAVSMPFLTTDYNTTTGAAQIVSSTAHTLRIIADKASFTVSVRTGASTFSFTPSSGDANPGKPASDLAVRAPAFSTSWIPLSSSAQALMTGGFTSKNPPPTAIDYRLDSNLATDPPGSYSISVIYTMTSP